MTTLTQDKSVHTVVIKEDGYPLAGSGLGGSSTSSKIQERRDVLHGSGTEKSILDDIMDDPEDFRDSDGENEDVAPGQCGLHGAVTAQGGASPSKVVSGNAETQLTNEHFSLDEKQVVLGHPSASEMKSPKGDEENFCRQQVEIDGAMRTKVQAGRTRYFIIKSLNHHNFEQSIHNGIWATQAMNEPILNEAFENTARVLLIFSVNMSGHFQGYAQMISSIGQARAHVWNETNWGGTFNVEWIRLYDLPFQRTIHLKNPLNSFKPVKISRDCQELTEEIGEALCTLIDDGALGNQRTKRKNVHVEGRSFKKTHTERMPWASDDVYGIHGEGPWSSLMYPYGFPNLLSNDFYHLQVPPAMEGFNAQASITNLTEPSFTQHHRGSLKRSSGSPRKHSYEVLEERGIGDQTEGRGRAPSQHTKRSSRVCPSSRTTQFPCDEDDFLNMTYEEYLQQVGHANKHGRPHQGVTRVNDEYG